MDIFRKKMTLIAYLFLRLRPTKIVVRYMCKSSTWDYPSKRNMVNGFATLFELEQQHLRHIYCATGKQFRCKKCLLVIWKSLRLFVNTMSAVGKCSLPNRDNLMKPIHLQLSQKLKTFCGFILHFRNFG